MSNPLKYTCLFGGGAIRSFSYIGAMRAMEELNIKYDIIGGSSAGAIFATLLACGYKSYELENLFIKVNFELFRDIHFGLGKNMGISKGEIFISWLDELISRKLSTPKKNVRFKDLDNKLVIITTNLNEFKSQEFSKYTTPDFEIAKAIRISSSMPGLMPLVEYEGASLVDGDLQKAVPMWKLSDTLQNSESRILEYRLEGEYNPKPNPISFINTIYSCVTDIATDFLIELYGQNDRIDLIKLNTGGVFFADFNLSKESRRKLIEDGYLQTMEYFKNVLPKKKEKLVDVYLNILKFLKEIRKGIRINNVEEVQWWMGDLFITLCENKEIIDFNLYEKIAQMKASIQDSVSTVLLVHACYKNKKYLENEISDIIDIVENKYAEIQLFLQKQQ